jgi:hypothetical protein
LSYRGKQLKINITIDESIDTVEAMHYVAHVIRQWKVSTTNDIEHYCHATSFTYPEHDGLRIVILSSITKTGTYTFKVFAEEENKIA